MPITALPCDFEMQSKPASLVYWMFDSPYLQTYAPDKEVGAAS